MIRVLVTAAAAVTPLGPLDALWERLLAGESAVLPVGRFPTDAYPVKVAACIGDLGRTPARRATPGRGAGDADSLVLPLLARLAAQLGPIPADCRLITASTKGGIDVLERIVRGLPGRSRHLTLAAVPELAAGKFGLRHPGINISAACASSTIALARGASLIASGREDAVLVCGIDLVTEFVFSGFAALKALSPSPCRPFDRQRDGLSLGEGAAAILLMSPKRAQREGRPPLGQIAGWGVADDAHHITAPARDGCGLVDAVRRALAVADTTPEAVAGMSAHGTGTVYNDFMEITAHEKLFGDGDAPFYSVKGAIGHTLGAAGAIETAIALMALAHGTLPPTVGLREPEPRARGLVSARPRPLRGSQLLATNSGFGGINAALLLRKAASC